jgi:Phytanoyl-CoA dioxygenase (PhyH)
MVCDNSKEAKLNEEEMIMADTTIRCTWSAVTLVLPAIAPLRLVCRRDHYDIVSYELEPGDMLVHHHLTVHGSAGNATFRQTRRAASLRYCGDDIRFKFRSLRAGASPFPPPAQGRGSARLCAVPGGVAAAGMVACRRLG